ncbi:MAG: hypothetical protein HY744_14190 [Deltaproteobacteria bacterium]|nr:hypothetical protein [Deltaproteobacteria bacterium]
MPPPGPCELTAPIALGRLLAGLWVAALGALAPVVLLVIGEPVGGAAGGLLFTVLGLAFALGRRGAVVDAASGTVTIWWGVWVPIGRKRRPLGQPSHVTLSREVHGSGRSRVVVHALRLHGAGVAGGDQIELVAPQRYEAARRSAEKLARYCGVAMHDSSSGTLVVREASSLDQPLRERLWRERGGAPAPSPTPPGRLVVRQDGDETLCVLPPEGLHMQHGFMILAILIALAGVLQIWGGVSAQAQGPIWLRYAVPGGLLLPLLLFAARLAGAAAGRVTVRFSHRGLSLRGWGLLGRTQRISVEAIEELTVVEPAQGGLWSPAGSGHLVARSDERTLVLGLGLREDELRWLYDAICHALASTAFGYSDDRAGGPA